MTTDAWSDLFAGLDAGWLAPRPTMTLVDLGSGDGRHAGALAADGHRVVAVDREPGLALALDVPPGCYALVSDGRGLGLRSESVDGAAVLEVLEHVPADGPALILRELHRILRPGARLVVSVPTSYTERIYGRLHPRYATNATHVRVFRKDELQATVEAAGFTIEAIDPRNLFSAVSWLVHAALRTDADAVGRVLEHEWVDRWLLRAFRVACRTPVIRRIVSGAARRVGKSWYVRCVRA